MTEYTKWVRIPPDVYEKANAAAEGAAWRSTQEAVT